MAASGYREHAPPPDLAADVACTWTGRIGDDGVPYTDRVLPDGCVDVIWDGTRLFVAGPDTGPVSLAPRAGTTFVGVRLRPGRATGVLGRPASDVRDQRPDLADLWPRAAVERLAAGVAQATEHVADAAAPATGAAGVAGVVGPAQAAARAAGVEALLVRAVRRRLADAPPADRVVDALIAALRDGAPTGPGMVSALADHLGVTERSLHRRCSAAVGYGPKTLDRVLRFRRALALAAPDTRGPGATGSSAMPSLGTLAITAGYADQAHLSRECRRLSGRTPSELFKTAA